MAKFEAVICGKSHAPALRKFMRANWSERHIMANSAQYLDYFFYDKKRGRYNIICAIDSQTERIAGFIAFVPASFYDSEIPPQKDFVWVTNWLAAEKAKGAGIALYAKMLDVTHCAGLGTVGQNMRAEAIYKKLGYETGALKQYFMLREQGRGKAGFFEAGAFELEEIGEGSHAPYKTPAYIINKYMKSPYYKYYAYVPKERPKAALIFRVQKQGGERFLRIVELFGDELVLEGKGEAFQELLEKFGAKRLDFYCHGIRPGLLETASLTENVGQIIIPDFYEPFVNKNIEIRYAYKLDNAGKESGFTVFKGDCDRDFPRLISY